MPFDPYKENAIKRKNVEDAIHKWFEDPIRNRLIHFDFGENEWSAKYHVPLDNSGTQSEWVLLCCGPYYTDYNNIVKRIIHTLTDKLLSVSQDVNDLLSTPNNQSLNKTPNTSTTMQSSSSTLLSIVKKLALKATNPDESILREAGIHDDCGALTNDGKALLIEILREKYKTELVDLAKQIITENNKK